MNIREFEEIKEVEYDGDIQTLKVGELFLMGESMIAQKENKTLGDEVSVYKVVKNINGHVQYYIEFIKLEI